MTNKQPIKLFDFWQETVDALTRETVQPLGIHNSLLGTATIRSILSSPEVLNL